MSYLFIQLHSVKYYRLWTGGQITHPGIWLWHWAASWRPKVPGWYRRSSQSCCCHNVIIIIILFI